VFPNVDLTPNSIDKASYHDKKLQNTENSMQTHHEVTLSCLWHVVNLFLYFEKSDSKHGNHQRILKM
jgi:hypothetical protein